MEPSKPTRIERPKRSSRQNSESALDGATDATRSLGSVVFTPEFEAEMRRHGEHEGHMMTFRDDSVDTSDKGALVRSGAFEQEPDPQPPISRANRSACNSTDAVEALLPKRNDDRPLSRSGTPSQRKSPTLSIVRGHDVSHHLTVLAKCSAVHHPLWSAVQTVVTSDGIVIDVGHSTSVDKGLAAVVATPSTPTSAVAGAPNNGFDARGDEKQRCSKASSPAADGVVSDRTTLSLDCLSAIPCPVPFQPSPTRAAPVATSTSPSKSSSPRRTSPKASASCEKAAESSPPRQPQLGTSSNTISMGHSEEKHINVAKELDEMEMRMAATAKGYFYSPSSLLCYACGLQIASLYEAGYHLRRCGEKLNVKIEQLAAHPLCEVTVFPYPPPLPVLLSNQMHPSFPSLAVSLTRGQHETDECLFEYNRRALRIYDEQRCHCRGCGNYFGVEQMSDHLSRTCPRNLRILRTRESVAAEGERGSGHYDEEPNNGVVTGGGRSSTSPHPLRPVEVLAPVLQPKSSMHAPRKSLQISSQSRRELPQEMMPWIS